MELLKTQGLTPVTQQQGKAVAQKMGALYMECSSKEMSGVHEIFDTAIDMAVRGPDQFVDDGHGGPGSRNGVSGGGMAMKRPKRSKCKIL